MKIAVCSDLHLEFGPIELKNPGGVEVLILSGDIFVERVFWKSERSAQKKEIRNDVS
jgi:predicted phosphodiesterase